LGKEAEADADLDRVDARVLRGETGVGDVQEADLGAPVVFLAQEVQARRAASNFRSRSA